MLCPIGFPTYKEKGDQESVPITMHSVVEQNQVFYLLTYLLTNYTCPSDSLYPLLVSTTRSVYGIISIDIITCLMLIVEMTPLGFTVSVQLGL